MRPALREFLELVKDCSGAEEAKLMLQACGFGLYEPGPGFGWDREGYYIAVLQDKIVYSENESLKGVRYGAIRDLLATLEAA